MSDLSNLISFTILTVSANLANAMAPLDDEERGLWGLAEQDDVTLVAGLNGALWLQIDDSWTAVEVPSSSQFLAAATHGAGFLIGGLASAASQSPDGSPQTPKGAIWRATTDGQLSPIDLNSPGPIFEIKPIDRKHSLISGVGGYAAIVDENGIVEPLGIEDSNQGFWGIHIAESFWLLGGGSGFDGQARNGAAGTGIILRSANDGQTWSVVWEDVNRVSDFSFLDDRRGFAVADSGSVLKTSDGGQTWAKIETSFNSRINAIALSADGCGLMVGVQGQVKATKQDSQQWRDLKTETSTYLEDVVINQAGDFLVSGGDGFLQVFQKEDVCLAP